MPRPRKKVVVADAPVAEVAQPTTNTNMRRSRRMSNPAFIATASVLVVLVVVGAVVIGSSDRGQIDVTAAIQTANQVSRDAYGENAVVVNTTPEELRKLPNGGLVPQGNPESAPPPAEVVASTTASTTEAGTSSTTPENTETTETSETNNTEATPQPDTSADEATETNSAPPAEGVTP